MNHMKNVLQSLLTGGLLIGLVPAQAQLNCGSGAAPGTDTQCTTDGLTAANLEAPITLFAPANGSTRFTSTVGQILSFGGQRTMTGSGDGAIEVVVGGHLGRTLDFAGHTGELHLRVAAPDVAAGYAVPGGFRMGSSVLGSGADRLSVDHGAVFAFSVAQLSSALQSTMIDFGAGDDRVHNAGHFMVADSQMGQVPSIDNGPGQVYGRDITLSGLERFENEGVIALGGVLVARFGEEPFRPVTEFPGHLQNGVGLTDGVPSTALMMPGTHFVGGPGSVIHLDAVFRYGAGQSGCGQRLQRSVIPEGAGGNGPAGSPGAIPTLVAADCIDLTGGQTSGVTELVINDWQAGLLAANFGEEEIVLIDVGGGESAAEHFVLSSQSQHYDAGTGTVQSGFVMFPLVYDAEQQQHKLVSLPGARAWALPHIAQGVQALARSIADDVAAPRDTSEGTWVRLSNRRQSRDVQHLASRYGQVIGVDSTHDIDSTVLTVGRTWQASQWQVGGALNYIDAAIGFDASQMQADLNGVGLALHADYRGDAWFIDNRVLMQWLQMDLGDPSMNLLSRGHYRIGYGYFFDPSPAYRNQMADSGSQTLHLRSELGWRLTPGEQLTIEPLAGLSWVRAELDEVAFLGQDNSLAPNQFFGDHADSLRATVGGRAAFTESGERFKLRATGSLRYWQSLKDKTTVTIANAGPDLVVEDDFDGGWTELNAGLELASPSGRVAGQLEAQALVGDYEGYGVTAGVRFQW